jgi:hypothetical protein
MALGVALVRKGILDTDDLARAADEVERGGESEAAHALRLIGIEGHAPPQSEWEADRRRSQIHIVRDGD